MASGCISAPPQASLASNSGIHPRQKADSKGENTTKLLQSQYHHRHDEDRTVNLQGSSMTKNEATLQPERRGEKKNFKRVFFSLHSKAQAI